MKQIARIVFVTLLFASAPFAHAALFTTNFGTALPAVSDCDDCAEGPFVFGGGQSINFFGGIYAGFYVSSNGYLTFDTGHTQFSGDPIDTQTVGPMIAGFFSDLDTSADSTSNIYLNNSTPGELIVTYEMVSHSFDQTVRSTFQLVVRSDQIMFDPTQGQLGFFYGDMTDPNFGSAGFGDGLAAVNPGEVSFLSFEPGTNLDNNAPRWFNLGNSGAGDGTGNPPPGRVPEPACALLLGVALALLAARRGAAAALPDRRPS